MNVELVIILILPLIPCYFIYRILRRRGERRNSADLQGQIFGFDVSLGGPIAAYIAIVLVALFVRQSIAPSSLTYQFNLEIVGDAEAAIRAADKIAENSSYLIVYDQDGKQLGRTDALTRPSKLVFKSDIGFQSSSGGIPASLKIFPANSLIDNKRVQLNSASHEYFVTIKSTLQKQSANCYGETSSPWHVPLQFQWIEAATGPELSRFRQVIAIETSRPEDFGFVEFSAYTVNGEFHKRQYQFRRLKKEEFNGLLRRISLRDFPGQDLSDSEMINILAEYVDEAARAGNFVGYIDPGEGDDIRDISDPDQLEAIDGRVRFRPREQVGSDEVILMIFDGAYVARHGTDETVVRRAGQMAISDTCLLLGLITAKGNGVRIDVEKVERHYQPDAGSVSPKLSIRKSETFAFLRAGDLRRNDLVRVLAPIGRN